MSGIDSEFKNISEDFLKSVRQTNQQAKDLIDLLKFEFSISKAQVQYKFKKIYGIGIQEARRLRAVPSKEEMTEAILVVNNVHELWRVLRVNKYQKRNLFQTYFGSPTFSGAKARLILDSPIISYDHNPKDPLALAISQLIGDGKYIRERGAFDILHGPAQSEYVYYKAHLFNLHFPNMKPIENVRVRESTNRPGFPLGYKTTYWYTGRLPLEICSTLENNRKFELIKHLTPLGILLLILDDGWVDLNLTVNHSPGIEIYFLEPECGPAFQDLLLSYQVESCLYDRTNGPGIILKVQSAVSVARFYKQFLEPFKHNLPKCMLYKTQLITK